MGVKGGIYIGTSNVVIPGNKQGFPENFRNRSRLHYYSTLFNTVEINSCFYKTPMMSTYERWTAEVGGDFKFSLKLSKGVTHSPELKYEIECLDKFMDSAKGTGPKKGCLLIQFPGKITLDYFTEVDNILSLLQSHDQQNEWNKAVEFRDHSWYIGETDEMIAEYNSTLVLHDMAKGKLQDPRRSSSFMYLRFHGPEGNYRGSYSQSQLEQKALTIREWSEEGRDVFAYFNNTLGNGFENARTLRDMILNPALSSS